MLFIISSFAVIGKAIYDLAVHSVTTKVKSQCSGNALLNTFEHFWTLLNLIAMMQMSRSQLLFLSYENESESEFVICLPLFSLLNSNVTNKMNSFSVMLKSRSSFVASRGFDWLRNKNVCFSILPGLVWPSCQLQLPINNYDHNRLVFHVTTLRSLRSNLHKLWIAHSESHGEFLDLCESQRSQIQNLVKIRASH